MGANTGMEYLTQVRALLDRLEGQKDTVARGADLMASAIAGGRLVHVFGSGHSVIPAQDIFPRYGSFVGFHPLLDPRLMWFNVIGPGGAPELLWVERQEGYVRNFLQSQPLASGDVLMVFSHGGLNAAPVEAALYGKERGLSVVAVTSVANGMMHAATHSSGKRLMDVADVVVDNAVPPEDALIRVQGLDIPVAAGSTVAAVTLVGAFVSEVAIRLAKRGIHPRTFVSPNVPGVHPDHNRQVFSDYARYVTLASGSAPAPAP